MTTPPVSRPSSADSVEAARLAEVYDSPRAVRARAKGLAAPFIPGGEDPDPAAGLAEERHFGRLLLLMVVAMVGAGFVIGIAIALSGLTGAR